MDKLGPRWNRLYQLLAFFDCQPMAFAAPVKHSKNRINRAGQAVRSQDYSPDDLQVINDWRASHAYVLNTFQAIHRNRTRFMPIEVGQRLKRLNTIVGKLSRLPKMELVRMDDVAGCRVIFKSIQELYDYRSKFLKARVSHVRKNTDFKYDYIASAKPDGYRGVHDVYEYQVHSQRGQLYNGLLLELQYRTVYQHAWATSVEVVGLITANQPKFNEGDLRYKEFFRIASEIIARVFENRTSCLSTATNAELVHDFRYVDGQINLCRTLREVNKATDQIRDSKNVLLIFSKDEKLEIFSFKRSRDALLKYFELERSEPTSDIVFVRADTAQEIRSTFRNYFSDTVDFLYYLEEGVRTLEKS